MSIWEDNKLATNEKETNKREYIWMKYNTQMFKDGIIPDEFDEKVDQAIRIVRKKVYSDKF